MTANTARPDLETAKKVAGDLRRSREPACWMVADQLLAICAHAERLAAKVARLEGARDAAQQKIAEAVVIAEQRTTAGQAEALREIARFGRAALAALAADGGVA